MSDDLDPPAGEAPAAEIRAKPRKAPNAFRTISEVADDLHIPQHVLRFWETKFLQVKPLKRGGGRRYYRPDDIALLRRISDLLYTQGYTIKGVQRLLRDGGGKLSDDIPPAPIEERQELDSEGMVASVEPQLPMPGLAPMAPRESNQPVPGRPARAKPDPRSSGFARYWLKRCTSWRAYGPCCRPDAVAAIAGRCYRKHAGYLPDHGGQ